MAAFDFLNLKKSIAGIGDQSRQLRADLEAAKREREEIAAAPIPRDELGEVLCQWVDKIGERYPANLEYVARHIRDDAERDPMAAAIPPLLLGATAGGSQNTIQPAALCYLFADVMKDGMRRAAAEMPYPAPEGLPRAERLKKLDALDKKIAKLEADLLALHREADQAGVVLRDEALPGKLKA